MSWPARIEVRCQNMDERRVLLEILAPKRSIVRESGTNCAIRVHPEGCTHPYTYIHLIDETVLSLQYPVEERADEGPLRLEYGGEAA